MKVYIAVDMEGVAGVANGGHLFPGVADYARFREIMTGEALAAIEGAKAAGAKKIVVSDCHLNADNLLVERLPKDVRLITSWPRRQFHMAGLDSSFDAVLLIGFHASATSLDGVRAHTFTSIHFTRLALNGVAVSEAVFNAAIAGHHDVPVVMMSGDDAGLREARAVLGDIEEARTKKALGFHAANTLTPEASCALIAKKAKAALERVKDFEPYKLPGPISVEVTFKSYRGPEVLAYLRSIERVDARTIRYKTKDMLEAADFMTFLISYNLALEP